MSQRQLMVEAPHGDKKPQSKAGLGLLLTQLVGELLTEDGDRGADALKDRSGEGGADGQAVDEVVQAVAQRDHPGQRADVRVGRPLQPIAASAAAPGLPPTL